MEIVELLNAEIKAALRNPKFKPRITDLGVIAFENMPPEFGRHLADETEKWGKVVKFLGREGGLSHEFAEGQFRTFRFSADHSYALWTAVGSPRLEKRPGAGFNVVTEAVVLAPADGYTLPGRQP